MWDCSHYQSLSRKESPKLYCCSLFGDSTGHQSHRSLCDLLSFWEFCQDGPLPRPWFPFGRNGARIFLGFIQTDSIQKNIVRLYMNMIFRDLSKAKSSSKSWCKRLMNSLIRDATWYLVASLPASSKSMSQHGSSPRSVQHRLLLFSLLMVLSFLLSLCSEADAFVGSSLLTSFGVAPVLAFLVIGPMLDVKNLLMMKNYLKTRFIWQFIGIVCGVVLLYAWFVGVVL